MKTMKELAADALAVQDAVNISGVVKGFDRALTDLRRIAEAEGWSGTDKINQHHISVLWSSKISSLTGVDVTGKFLDALTWAQTKQL